MIDPEAGQRYNCFGFGLVYGAVENLTTKLQVPRY